MITNHHWGSTTSVGGSGANLRFTPYNVPLDSWPVENSFFKDIED